MQILCIFLYMKFVITIKASWAQNSAQIVKGQKSMNKFHFIPFQMVFDDHVSLGTS